MLTCAAKTVTETDGLIHQAVGVGVRLFRLQRGWQIEGSAVTGLGKSGWYKGRPDAASSGITKFLPWS